MAARHEKVIISCAITGSIHTPTMTPYLPITGEQIAGEAIAAAEAGAAILHLHARDPKNGRPSHDPTVFSNFLPRIKSATDAIVNISTGGGHGMTVDERIAAAATFKPEMCSLNMGSMNFCLHPLLTKYSQWQYEWEPAYLQMTKDFVFRNTFEDIEKVVKRLAADGARFEFECYDLGHLYNLAHFLDRGIVQPPLFIQLVFGILGGAGADAENFVHMRRIARELFGDDFQWSVLAAGRHQMPFATLSAVFGGNVRVGLEDSIYLSKGVLAESNAQQVKKIRSVLEALGYEIASPDEARAQLQLKGADQVGF